MTDSKLPLDENGSPSIVRNNLMNERGYTPYCGSDTCKTIPRTFFNGEQFQCPHCGWKSRFGPEFIEAYTTKWRSAALHAQTEAQPGSVTCQIYGHVIGHCSECNVGLENKAVEVINDVEHDAKILRRYVPESCLGMVDGILATIANNRLVIGGTPCDCAECQRRQA